jgi:hypothetical protein
MRPNDYLERIRKKLKGFSPQEKLDFIDEIASHIESGQEDASLGEEGVMAELGTPEQMEHGLRTVHRPNRLVDVLLVLIPGLTLSICIQLLLNITYGTLKEWTVTDPHVYLGGRIAFLLAVLLALIGMRRSSVPLIIFWLTDSIGTLVSIMTREARFIPGQEQIPGSIVESLLMYAILVALLFWLVRILRQNRFDLLLLIYTLLPLMLIAANFTSVQILHRLTTSEQTTLTPPFGPLGILGYQLIWAMGVSIFFLSGNRNIRWIGMLFVSVYYVIPNILIYSSSISLFLIWSGILAVMLSGWILDWFNQRANVRD